MEGQWLDQLPIMKRYTLEDKVVSWLARYSYFICKVSSTNRVLLLKNILCTLCLRGWGFHAMLFLNFNIMQGASIMELF